MATDKSTITDNANHLSAVLSDRQTVTAQQCDAEVLDSYQSSVITVCCWLTAAALTMMTMMMMMLTHNATFLSAVQSTTH